MGVAMVKKKKLIITGAIVAITVAVVVFVGLCFSRQWQTPYGLMKKEAEKLVFSREKAERLLDLSAKSIKLTDEEQGVVEDFEKEVPEDADVQTVLQRIKDKNGGRDERIERLVNEVARAYVDLSAVLATVRDMKVMFDGELSDEDLAHLSESNNEYLVKLATDLKGYREKVNKLDPKDKNFEKNYKALIDEGDKLNKKYANVDFDSLMRCSRGDALAYYEKVEELNSYLSEKAQ